jgi:hypothetical protein
MVKTEHVDGRKERKCECVSPFEEIRNAAWAEYAILSTKDGSLSVEMYRIPFDIQAVIQAVLSSGMPHAEWWISEWSSIS